MRVGIICAGDLELAPFLPVIKNRKTTEKAMLKFYEGTIGGVEVVNDIKNSSGKNRTRL